MNKIRLITKANKDSKKNKNSFARHLFSKNKILFFICFLFQHVLFADVKYQITCERQSDCPSWVLGIAIQKENQNGVCSGFLVQNDVVATNRHCIPESLQYKGARCQGILKVFFPKTEKYEEESFDCDQVIWTSPPLEGEFLRLDYAYFRLRERVRREVLGIDPSGVQDMEKLFIYKVDPEQINNHLQGVVRKVLCTAIQNSLLNPFFREATSPLLTLTGCFIKKGNSGSAIVDSSGNAKGIISSISESYLPKQFQQRKGFDKILLAMGTNYHCIPIPPFIDKSTLQGGEACLVKTSESFRQELATSMQQFEVKKAIEEINKKVNEQLKSVSMGGKRLFHWKAMDFKLSTDEIAKGAVSKAITRPFCLLPGLKESDIKKYTGKLKKEMTTMNATISDYLIYEDLDEQFRYKMKVIETPLKILVSFIPNQIFENRVVPIEMKFLNDNGPISSSSLVRVNVPLCLF